MQVSWSCELVVMQLLGVLDVVLSVDGRVRLL